MGHSSTSSNIKVTKASQLKVGQSLRIVDKTHNIQNGSLPRIMIGTIMPSLEISQDQQPIEQDANQMISISRDQIIQGEPPGNQSKNLWTIQISHLLAYFEVEINLEN